MASRNDITGDSLTSRAASSAYRDGWDNIFGKKIKYTDCKLLPKDVALRLSQTFYDKPNFEAQVDPATNLPYIVFEGYNLKLME
jgi:hypothetical protein